MPRIITLAVALIQLQGCTMSPRIDIPERLTFDQPPPSQAPLSYGDMLCSTHSIYNS